MNDKVVTLTGTPLLPMGENRRLMLEKLETIKTQVMDGQIQALAIAAYRTDGAAGHMWHAIPGQFFALCGAVQSLQFRMMEDEKDV